MLSLILTNILICLTYSQTKEEYYANWFGKLSSSTDIETTNRIIDVILPGSHHAGMYISAIESNGYMQSTDGYYDDVMQYGSQIGPVEERAKWCQRQIGTIKDQLDAGSRFLDIRLEKISGDPKIYAHHGFLGATLATVCTSLYIEST